MVPIGKWYTCGMSYEKMEVSQEMCLGTIFLATFPTKNNHLMNAGSQSALCAACWPNRHFFGGGGHISTHITTIFMQEDVPTKLLW